MPRRRLPVIGGRCAQDLFAGWWQLILLGGVPRALVWAGEGAIVRRTVITGRDLVRAVPPTEEDDVPDDEVLRPRVRDGDVLVPTSSAS
jgi:hypothetical protein